MTILLYAQYGHLAIWPCTTKEGKWDIPEKRIKCSSAVKSQFWVEMVHFFGTVLDILVTKHTKRKKCSETLCYFDTPKRPWHVWALSCLDLTLV